LRDHIGHVIALLESRQALPAGAAVRFAVRLR
jgi:hypothetical protein